MTQTYEKKPDGYFSQARTEIRTLLPEYAERVLEIGCGSGGTLAWLKGLGIVGHATGIELELSAAEKASKNIDCLIAGDVETLLDQQTNEIDYDLILCLDVLEHLVDPWETINKVASILKPGGIVIASIPNVRHFSVLMPLVFKGRWQYVDVGILDKTHLRFFTRETAADLLQTRDLMVYSVTPNIRPGSKSDLARKLSLGLLTDLCAKQYLVCARKVETN